MDEVDRMASRGMAMQRTSVRRVVAAMNSAEQHGIDARNDA